MKRNRLTKLAGVVAAVAVMCSGITVSAAEDSVYTTQEGDTNQQLVIPGDAVTIQQPVPQDMPTPAAWPEASAEWQTAVALGGPSYVEQNGLQFYQGTSYKSQGKRSYGEWVKDGAISRYSSWSEFFESSGMITGITIRDAEKEGYQVVTISSVSEGD